MAVNPNIALSVRGLELPDPLAQYGKVQAIQAAQQQNALAQMQMRQLEREQQQQNALREFIAGGVTPENRNKLLGFGEAGQKLYSTVLSGEKTKAEQQKAETDLLDAKLKQSRNFLDTLDVNAPDAADRYIAWHEANHADPVIGPALAARGVTVDTARAQINEALSKPGGLAELIERSKLGTEKFMEMDKPQVVDLGGKQAFVNPRTGQVVSSFEKTPLPEDVAAQKRELTRPLISMPPAEKAEQAARGAQLVKDYQTVRDDAQSARSTLPAIDANLAKLNRGFETGAFTPAKAAAANVLSALGVKNAEQFATDAQTFLAAVQQQVLVNQLLQKGTQTEGDYRRISETGAQLGNTAEANKFILSVAKAQSNRAIEQQKFYADWYRQNRTYDGAEEAWLETEGNKSIFDRPELKDYREQTMGPVVAPTQVQQQQRVVEDVFKNLGFDL